MNDRTKHTKQELLIIKQNPRINIIEIDGIAVLECNHRPIRTKTNKVYSPKELDTLSYCLPIQTEQKFLETVEDGDDLPERYTWSERSNVIKNPLGYTISAKFQRKARQLTLKESIAKYNGGTDIPSVIKELTALASGTSKSKTPSISLAANKLLLEAYYKDELSKTSTQNIDVNVKHDFMKLITAARKQKQLKNITDNQIIESSIQ